MTFLCRNKRFEELPVYPALDVRENLRQPLEDGKVTISRALMSLSYPARFMLAVALNPCPCGYFTDPRHDCSCRPEQIQKYMAKISGPLLDRIDIHVEVPALSYEELAQKQSGRDSSSMREAVIVARERQQTRFASDKKIYCNAHMESRHLKKHCELDESSQNLLRTAIEKLGLSARAYDRILKVARTVADLANEENIQSAHIAEAIQYRSLDRKLWLGG